jgi:putative transposase
VRLREVLKHLGVARSSWYAGGKPVGEHKRPGPSPKPVPAELVEAIVTAAEQYPWWGYKRVAIVLRRQGLKVSNKQVWRVYKAKGLLQPRRRPPRLAELYQALKLYELLPRGPNDLWQADVTYIHIPGHGWWYAVTAIDYYSRYLLALHLTASFTAVDVGYAIELAHAEAEWLCGPLAKVPFLVTDNGSSFLARRFQRQIQGQFAHVRIRYRTPTQLGLLERFHETLKSEEVYWQLYQDPTQARESLAAFRQRYNEVRPHWALIPEGGGDVLTPAEVYIRGAKTELPKWQRWAQEAKRKLDEQLKLQALPSAA